MNKNTRNSSSSRTIRSFLLILILLLAAGTASGCVEGNAAVNVSATGNVDVSAAIGLPSQSEVPADLIIKSFSQRMQEYGFETSSVNDGDMTTWTFKRHYDRSEIFTGKLGDEFELDITGLRLAYKREHSWLYNIHTVEVVIQPGEMLADSQLYERYRKLPALVRRLAERRVDLDISLNMPYPPADHNADISSRGGRSLTWSISPTADTPVKLTVYGPNTGTFVAVFILIACLATLLIWLITRLRRRLRARRQREGNP
ncbi:hypothetical protein DNH61_13200 [Paenibacillus sambharensis]|uniref:DUF3153 domain-containing protein n=1 Tax=Paenibacillus sambharensis TaxID=1803190 RepID=A0A2W1LLU3_9BACL|nr:hypothetical protein [Paenibacillus sambharensis]PZD95484.1 hypothetical protein DNH61_13200 [Paenibacillus sambharensis]